MNGFFVLLLVLTKYVCLTYYSLSYTVLALDGVLIEARMTYVLVVVASTKKHDVPRIMRWSHYQPKLS